MASEKLIHSCCMNKILIVSIVPGSAVDILSEMIKKYNEHLFIDILPFHPKRFNQDDLKLFEEKAKWADLIDFQYWKSAVVLLEKFSWLKDKPKVLTHHNPYDLDKISPDLFQRVIVKNKTQQEDLPGSVYIPHSVDLDLFTFNDEYDYNNKTVGMVAFRIEGKKGIKEVAQACKELGYKFFLIGHISKPNYFKDIMKVNSETIFVEDVPHEELSNLYKQMGVLVCNSVDFFESGTMPILEAMASGIPVLTRNIGLVPDIYNNVNLQVRNGQPEDIDDLKESLVELMENKEKKELLRNNGWQSVKSYSDYRMAVQYEYVYNQAMFPIHSLVSIVTPTFDRRDLILNIIKRLQEQTYKNIELVVCDDNSSDGTEEAVKSMREEVDFPIKYLNTNKDGYNLAMARNLGVIQASGEYLLFLDSRFLPEKDTIEQFVKNMKEGKIWLFGEKGGNKTNFVENFSMIRRCLFIRAGMCNERIDAYGGMSQELRERFITQGFKMIYTPTARAKEMVCAQKISKRRKDIVRMKNLLWKIRLPSR